MWNQRIQRLDGQLAFLQDSRVPGWTARDAASKPYLAVDSQGNVFATDPGESRVLVFDRRGRLHHFIRNMDAQHVPLRQPSGIVIDPSDESLWVADSGNDRILRLRLSRPAASLSSVR
jgi:sugar lactone lactonase YvrE